MATAASKKRVTQRNGSAVRAAHTREVFVLLQSAADNTIEAAAADNTEVFT